jgi:hypothetical protein
VSGIREKSFEGHEALAAAKPHAKAQAGPVGAAEYPRVRPGERMRPRAGGGFAHERGGPLPVADLVDGLQGVDERRAADLLDMSLDELATLCATHGVEVPFDL